MVNRLVTAVVVALVLAGTAVASTQMRFFIVPGTPERTAFRDLERRLNGDGLSNSRCTGWNGSLYAGWVQIRCTGVYKRSHPFRLKMYATGCRLHVRATITGVGKKSFDSGLKPTGKTYWYLASSDLSVLC